MVLVTVPALTDEGVESSPSPPVASPVDPPPLAVGAATGGAKSGNDVARTRRVLVGWSAVSLGAIGIGLGSYYGLRAFSKKSAAEGLCHGNACPQAGLDLYSDMKFSEAVSTVAFAVGLASAAGGAYLLFTQDSPARPAASRTFIAPVVSTHHAGAVLGSAW
jgi:serine/threonine-protein kinase